MSYKRYIDKAKKLEAITPKEACIYMNCLPAQDLLDEELLQYTFNFREGTINNAKLMIKETQKRIGIGKHLHIRGMASAAIYLAAVAGGERKTQKEICKYFNIEAATLRIYLKRIKRSCDV